MHGALLVAGTTSDAGKSVLVAGVCRWLARQGVDVAPFKAQNMSNNSVVTTDGGEIGRAQALQAAACGLAPSVAFNPVLLKPGSDRTSQVVVHGRVDGSVSALSYRERKPALLEIVTAGLARLRAEHDVVICEGAGSPAEINLRATDIANMGLARAGSLPTIVVGDIDRGGVLAHLFGTVAVLDPADQALISGFVVNKFRGDPALLEPGLAQLERLTGRPTLGVVPFAPDLWIDAEDSLGHDGTVGRPGAPLGRDWLRVAVVRLPRVSNGTDVDALACEPGVSVRYVTAPSDLVGADLVVLPGSKATVSDLTWLRSSGLADAVLAHARAGRPLLGICGGYQMLARTIDDPHGVEAAPGRHEGLGLGAFDVVFDPDKHLGNPQGSALGEDVAGYEIHHGRELRDAGVPALVRTSDGAPEGLDVGNVLGTHWHGLLENDGFRRRVLARVATLTGRDVTISATTSFAATRAAQLDLLADLVETHLDTTALTRLIEQGAPAGLRIVPPAGAP